MQYFKRIDGKFKILLSIEKKLHFFLYFTSIVNFIIRR